MSVRIYMSRLYRSKNGISSCPVKLNGALLFCLSSPSTVLGHWCRIPRTLNRFTCPASPSSPHVHSVALYASTSVALYPSASNPLRAAQPFANLSMSGEDQLSLCGWPPL